MLEEPESLKARVLPLPDDDVRLGDVSAAELLDIAVEPDQPHETREALRSFAATLIGGYAAGGQPEPA